MTRRDNSGGQTLRGSDHAPQGSPPAAVSMLKMNNFDLIRLAAALQVAVTHSIPNFLPHSGDSPLLFLIKLFPGVPVFFFVSGFLISKSFESNSNTREFALNRCLRIYPGLAVCFLVSLTAVWLTGYFATVRVSLSGLLYWSLAQLSVVQFYNPDFMRHFGVGVLNGSMWTIAVELQFYALVPALYALLRTRAGTRRWTNAVLLALCVLFALLNRAYVAGSEHYAHEIWFKVVGVSFLPWFGMFLVGVLFQKNFELAMRWLGGHGLPLLVFYCMLALAGHAWFGWDLGNTMSVPLFLALAALTFSAAFSRPTLSDRLLRRNDISYGVYIYHMPVVNLMLVLGLAAGAATFVAAMAATLACACLSWALVEKPALALKRHPFYIHVEASDRARRRLTS